MGGSSTRPAPEPRTLRATAATRRERAPRHLLLATALRAAIGTGRAAVQAGESQAAADLLVRNARVISGTGTGLARGWIEIREGRVESLVVGDSTAAAARALDAQGRTVPSRADRLPTALPPPHARATSEAELRECVDGVPLGDPSALAFVVKQGELVVKESR